MGRFTASHTTDNACSNTALIDELVELAKNQSTPFRKENHVNCFTHVINLAFKDALSVSFQVNHRQG